MNKFSIVILASFQLLLTNNMGDFLLQFEEIKAKLTYTEELLVNSKRIIYEYSVQNNINVTRIEYLEQRMKYYQTSEELKLQPDNRDEKIADLYSKICLYTDKVNMYRVQSEDRAEKIIELEKKLQVAEAIQTELSECVPMENANTLLKNCKEEIDDKVILLQAKLDDRNKKITNLEERVSVLNSQLQNRDEVTSSLKNKIIALKNQLEDRNQVMNDLKTDIKDKLIKIATMEKTIEEKKIMIEEKRMTIVELMNKLDKTKIKLKEAEELNQVFELSMKDQ